MDEADLSKSSVNSTIDASSVDTRVTMRDNDIKSDHFFDVTKFPTITFQSTKIWKTGELTAKMTGEFDTSWRDHEVTLDVSGPTAPITGLRSAPSGRRGHDENQPQGLRHHLRFANRRR